MVAHFKMCVRINHISCSSSLYCFISSEFYLLWHDEYELGKSKKIWRCIL